jgi:hypothetical protein
MNGRSLSAFLVALAACSAAEERAPRGGEGSARILSLEDAGQVSVSADRSSYESGEAITVSWAGLDAHPGAWVSIARVGSGITELTKWQYTGGQSSGTATFTAPAGEYEARAYPNEGYELVAASASFRVNASASTSPATIAVDQTSYPENGSAVISFGNMAGHATDWISIAPAGSPPTTFTRWQYTEGAASGSLTFALDGIEAGTYVARVYFNDSYTLEAETRTFTIGNAVPSVAVQQNGGEVTATYQNASGAMDWIAIAEPGSSPYQFVAWAYTPGAATGNVIFSGLPAGSYVTRLYFHNSYEIEAESAAFTVSP